MKKGKYSPHVCFSIRPLRDPCDRPLRSVYATWAAHCTDGMVAAAAAAAGSKRVTGAMWPAVVAAVEAAAEEARR